MTEAEKIQNMVQAYYLCKATNIHMKFVREFANPHFKKILSEASAKNNYFCTEIEKMIPKKELGNVEEIAMRYLEQVYQLELNLE